MGLLFCTACGTNLEPGATFCTNCGKSLTQESAPPAPAPPAPAPAPVAVPANTTGELPICLGCGIVAPAGRGACTACGFATAASPRSVPRAYGDLLWAGIQASIKCRACGGQAPIDGFDVKGPYPCLHCGIDQHMDPKQWNEALTDAHDVADLSGPGPGPFAAYAAVTDNKYSRIGVDFVKAMIDTGYEVFESIPLHVDVSPGNPLCEACHVPLEIVSADDPLVVRCPQCATTHTYERPHGSPHDLVGVVSHTNEQGVRDVAGERDPGGAVAIRCPGCSAPLPAAAIGAAVKCAYCGVTSRIGPAMRHAMGTKDATPPRWWALFRGPSRTRQRAHKAAEKAAQRAAARAASPSPPQPASVSERFDRYEQQAEVAGKNAERKVALTMAASVGMAAVVAGAAFWLTARKPTSSTTHRTAPVGTIAPAKPKPPAASFTVDWKGKVTAAKGMSLKRGTPCKAEMSAVGQAVKGFRVICGDTSLYSSQDAMSGMSSRGSAIIEAPGKDSGYQYLLLYHDVGQRTGRNEIQFNSMSSSTVSGHGPPAFEVTMSFDDLSTERMGAAVFPTSLDTSHQLFTAKVASTSGKAPVHTGQTCKADFFGRGVKADGNVCTVKLVCAGKNVYFTTGYCNTDLQRRPSTFTDKQSTSHFTIDVESAMIDMGAETATGSYTAHFALTPSKH